MVASGVFNGVFKWGNGLYFNHKTMELLPLNLRRKNEFIREYRKALDKRPSVYYIQRLMNLGSFGDEEMGILLDKVGYTKARHLAYLAGVDADWTPNDDEVPNRDNE